MKARPLRELVPSNVDWLGPVPQAWAVLPLKRVTSYVSRGISPNYVYDVGVPVINQACIYWKGIRWRNIKYHDSDSAVQTKAILRPGDLLMNSTGTGTLGRAAVFAPFAGRKAVLADRHVTVVRTTGAMNSTFLRYLLETAIYQGFVRSVLAVGATNQIELSREGLRRTPLPIPPKREQRAITDVLDRKTAAIDVLIAKKERLIALLEEKRQALITSAVIKGLDPNVTMKDSGIEWLGPIPAHWQRLSLRRAVKRAEYGISTSLCPEGQCAVLRMNNIQNGRLDLTDLKYSNDVDPALMLRAGDILYNRTNSWGLVGKAAVVESLDDPAVSFASYLVRLRMDRGVAVPRYFGMLLNSAWFLARARGHAIPSISQANLSASEYLALHVPVPPVPEQETIVTAMQNPLSRLEETGRRVTDQVKKLREYRQALITAAVTGKLDINKDHTTGADHRGCHWTD